MFRLAILVVGAAVGWTGAAGGEGVVLTAQPGLLSEARSALAMGVADLNGDRRDDIIRLDATENLRVAYQQAGGGFTEIDLGEIATGLGWSVCAADVDGSGINDLLIGGNAAYGRPEGLELFLADDTGSSFSRSMVKQGDLVVQGVIFTDIDNDGLADIFACHDLDDLQKFANLGDASFARNDGLLPTSLSPDDAGNYALIAADIDNDGDVDYYLSKCLAGEGDPVSGRRVNRLFVNNGDGSFFEPADARGLADGAQSWCTAFGDVDNDGDLDAFVLNHEYSAADPSGPSGPSMLYRNDGAGNFSEDSLAAGLTGALNFPGAQALLRDFDNDGWVDLLVSAIEPSGDGFAFFFNDGDGTFTAAPDVFQEAGGAAIGYLQSFAVGDLNGDGFLDVYGGLGSGLANPSSDPDLLFLNGGNGNGFFSLTLVGSESNPNGIGARVEAHGPWGVQVREVRGGEGYGIQNSLNVHFGLGAAAKIDRLVVRWPSRTGGANDVDEVLDVPAGGFGVLYQGTGRIAHGFADWIAGFPSLSGDELLPGSDPDRDGVANVFEQIKDGDPTHPDGPLPFAAERIESGSEEFIQVELQRAPVPGTRLVVEFSADGAAWAEHEQFEIRADTPMRLVGRLPLSALDASGIQCRLRAFVDP